MSTHSPLGGSAAERYIKCPASVNLVRKGIVKEDGAVVHAGEYENDEFSGPGTVAHELAAECLKMETDPFIAIGEVRDGIKIDAEMVNAVSEYVNLVRGTHEGRVICAAELSFHASTLHPLYYGTVDAVVTDWDADTMHIWDFKYGAGVSVEAVDNAQLKYYAAGLIETGGNLWNEIKYVMLHIVQPRAYHYAGTHRTELLTIDELKTWLIEILQPAMCEALTSDEAVAGPHCQFCPARFYDCAALGEVVKEVADAICQKDRLHDLSGEELVRIIELQSLFSTVRIAAEKVAMKRLEDGQVVADDEIQYTLEKKSKQRIWKDGAKDAAIEEFGEDRVYGDKKLKTPAQIEKLAGGKKFTAEWADKPPSDEMKLARSAKKEPDNLDHIFKDMS